jgi:hypothetical protein
MHAIRRRQARCDGGARWCAAAGRRRLADDGRSSAPELGLRRGLVLREEEDEANITRGLRGRFGRRSGHHGRQSERHKAGEWHLGYKL